MSDAVDLAVIGGGINGVGIARDAAGRGLKVLLCEQGDLAQATSSASTKLIHGGLRYLEQYEFRLVRESLMERTVLLRAAPHLVKPMRFVLPHVPELRPAWLIRAGLFLYDHLGDRGPLPGSHGIDLRADRAGAPLRESMTRGFVYSDCWVDDARMVVLNARDAADRGAEILTRTRCAAARRTDGHWRVELEPAGGSRRVVRARALVNAAGPWARDLLGGVLGVNRPGRLRLVKGSHIVVPRLFEGEHAYILQNDDRRIIFAIPYEGRFTLIGTTDVPFEGDPGDPRISAAETEYLCAAISRYFRQPVAPADVVWSYAGIRPLYDDDSPKASEVTRDYVFDLEAPAGEAPLLTVFGGKLTTYRRLAEHAMAKLLPTLGIEARPWTAPALLPGGDLPGGDREAYVSRLREARPWLPEAIARRWASAYGGLSESILDGAARLEDLGRDLGGGLHEAEIDYLRRREWAATADDVLWRRSKLGLHLGAEEREAVRRHLGDGR